VLLRPRDIGVFAINRRRGRKDELLDGVLLGEFEQVLGGDDIGALVADGIFDRRTDAGLGGKVDDGVGGGAPELKVDFVVSCLFR